MPLMMGIRVIAPKPILSQDPYPVFNVADASLVELVADRHFHKPQASNAELFAPQPSFEDKLPSEPKPTEEEVQQAVRKQYEAVKTTWEEPLWKAPEVKTFVEVWENALKWNVDAGFNSAATHGLSDIAAIPKNMKEQFMDTYMAPPLLAAVKVA